MNWSVLETPEGGAVTFSPPHGPATVATFSLPGFYKILISATNDGVNTGSTEVFVNAGLTPGDTSSSADAEVYLTMDEGEGITATDSRGGDNNGRLINGASWTGPGGGIAGTGIVLDGIDDQIPIENVDELNLRREQTVTFWFKADDPLQETKQVLYEDGDSSGGLNIYLEAGRLYAGAWVYDTNNSWKETYLSTELDDTSWHHVGLVLHAKLTGNDFFADGFKGFLDGFQFGSGNARIGLGRRDNITLGANGDTTRYHDGVGMDPGNHFAGIVDEFRLWKRLLTPFEVGQLFSKGGYIGPELTLSSVDHSAGSVVIPPGMGIVLDGSAKGNSSLETRWETVIAPAGGQANFGNSTKPSTFANFSTPGYYKLRFSADDSIQKSAIDVDVHAGLEAGSNFYSPEETVYFSMDEGSGEVVGNSGLQNFSGYFLGGPSWTSEGGGISGTALQFDGIDDQILIRGGSQILGNRGEKNSFALWMKPNEIGTDKREVIFEVGSNKHQGFNIYLNGNVLYFGNWYNGPISWKTFQAVPITRGKWHHLAVVKDADFSGLQPDGFRAYLNGRQVASGSASGMDFVIHISKLGGNPFFTGPFHDGLPDLDNIRDLGFAGIIDEFHCYADHALTIDEIGMLYAFGNIGPTVDAGPDQLAVPPYSMILLEGSSTDDGRWSSPVTYSWHIIDGPGTGRFRPLEDNGASAQIDFFEGGSYRIALGAYDGQMTTFDELMVTVRHPTLIRAFYAWFSRYRSGGPQLRCRSRWG